MQALNFEEVLDRILAQDPRYHREAYLFLREALDHTQKLIGKKSLPSSGASEVCDLLCGQR